jgi:iron complex outermembrane receptor protein
MWDRFANQLNIFQLNPISRRLWIYNGFLQDHYQLTDNLFVVAGIKVERSSFSGLQVLPNVRIGWQPSQNHLLWAAVSRAVRTPSRIDRQLEAPPFLIAAPSFKSEKLIAFEAGYRGQPASGASISVNTFVNLYDDLRTTEFTGTSFQLQNGQKGTTYGVEAWGSLQVTPWWRASLGATTLFKHLRDKDGHRDLIPRNSVGADPKWQLTARSQMGITDQLLLALDGRAVGALREGPGSESYVEAGGQLSYQLRPELQLFVAGRNLLHRTHSETNDPSGQLASRSIYGGLRSRF